MIDIGACLNFGIERFKQNTAYYLLGMLIVIGAQFALSMVSQVLGFIWGFVVGMVGSIVHPPELFMRVFAGAGGAAIGMILGILIAPLWVGFFKGIKVEADGGKAEVGVIFSAFNAVVPALLNYGIATIIIVIGFICCILPGIVLSPLMWLSVFFIALGVTEGVEPLKKSFALLKANPIIILWNLVLGLIAMVGILACGVGILVTMPVAACAFYMMCRQAGGETLASTNP